MSLWTDVNSNGLFSGKDLQPLKYYDLHSHWIGRRLYWVLSRFFPYSYILSHEPRGQTLGDDVELAWPGEHQAMHGLTFI